MTIADRSRLAVRISVAFWTCAVVCIFAFAYGQSDPVSVREDPAVGIARLEERVKALEAMVQEKSDQVKTALEAADRVTNKSFPSRTDFSELSNRVAALETGAAVGTGRSGGTTASRELVFSVLAIVVSGIGLVLALWKRRDVPPRSPSGG